MKTRLFYEHLDNVTAKLSVPELLSRNTFQSQERKCFRQSSHSVASECLSFLELILP